MMITPTDKDYKDTKLFKLGKKELTSPFKDLADWIYDKFDAKVLNIKYDFIQNTNRPRLNIIFDYHKDDIRFKDKAGSYDSSKQKLIADRFRSLINNNGLNTKFSLTRLFDKSTKSIYDTKDIWVTFSSFESVAKIEANESVPQNQVKDLQRQISNENIWEISRCFSGTTFFLYKDKQVETYKQNGQIEIWTKMYFDLLKKYDEFDYFKVDDFSINLDSKMNFDNNYESNWFYYYK